MTATEVPQFIKLMSMLAEIFPRPLNPVMMTLYQDALRDLEIQDLAEAATRLIRVRTSHFYPTPAEWRETAKSVRDERLMATPALAPPPPTAGEKRAVEKLITDLAAKLGWDRDREPSARNRFDKPRGVKGRPA
jgi:hypothetical protein